MDEASEDRSPLLPGQLMFSWADDEESDHATSAPDSSDSSDSGAAAGTPGKSNPTGTPSNQRAPRKRSLKQKPSQRHQSTKPAGAKKPRKKKRPPAGRASTEAASATDSTPSKPQRVKKKKPAAQVKRGRTARKVVPGPQGTDSTIKKTVPQKSQTSAVSKKVNSTTKRSPKSNLHEAVETIPLKWGAQFPTVGFGFWKVEQEAAADVCFNAIKTGYRHLDCACDYGNEQQVGEGIAKALKKGVCEREDLWVTSKLWNTYHAAEHVRPAFEKSLHDLGLEYLDLYLVHFPIAQRFVPFEKKYPPGWFYDDNAAQPVVEEAKIPLQETWQAMEELAKEGLVRNIGICNMGTSQIRDMLAYCSIRPAVLQVESHPYLTQEKLLRYCQQERIAYTAFSPLGASSYYSLGMADPSESVMENPVVTRIAKEVDRTAAQVLLRWGVQRGTSVIPKTSNRDRMVENLDIFDFKLTDQQMQDISALNQNRRFNDPGDFGEAAFNTFLPIYE